MVSKLCRALVTVVSGAFVLRQLVPPQVALVRERGLAQVALPSYLFMFGKFVPSEVSLGSELSTTLVTSVPHTLMLRQFVPRQVARSTEEGFTLVALETLLHLLVGEFFFDFRHYMVQTKGMVPRKTKGMMFDVAHDRNQGWGDHLLLLLQHGLLHPFLHDGRIS